MTGFFVGDRISCRFLGSREYGTVEEATGSGCIFVRLDSGIRTVKWQAECDLEDDDPTPPEC